MEGMGGGGKGEVQDMFINLIFFSVKIGSRNKFQVTMLIYIILRSFSKQNFCFAL